MILKFSERARREKLAGQLGLDDDSVIPVERILLLQVISMKHFIFCSIEDCVSD